MFCKTDLITLNQYFTSFAWRARTYQIANRLSFPRASRSSSWGPVHHSKCGDSRLLRNFAEPLCLIAPEFEPDRLPHCALPTHSAVGPISAVMEFSRKPLFPHRWKVLGISQQQSSKRLSSELRECHTEFPFSVKFLSMP